MEIELDLEPSKTVAEAPVAYERPIELDLLDPTSGCRLCGAKVALNADFCCRGCFDRQSMKRQAIPVIKADDLVEVVAAEPAPAGEKIPAPSSLESALGSAAALASEGATALQLGTVANGRASLDVGFSEASGYIESLRRGVTRPTFESYVSTLRRTYKLAVTVKIVGDLYTVTLADGEAFEARLIPVVSGGAEHTDSHTNDDAIAKMKLEIAAKKTAVAKITAEQALQNPLVSAPVVDDTRITLRHGELIAGGAAEGHGVLLGWVGKGPMTLSALTALAVSAEVPADAMPQPRDASTHARRAAQAFARGDVKLYTEDRGRKWRLERPVAGAMPGEKGSEVALVVTLRGESTLECEGDAALGIQVKAEFDRLVAGQIFDAGEITAWLVDDVLKGKCSAAKYGGNWYVARSHRDLAEKIVATFDGTWGRDWMNPALPIATSQQLAQGLARGLAADIKDIIVDVEKSRTEARAKGKEDIGAGAATTAIGKLRKESERVVAYSALLGESLVADCREQIRTEMESLSKLVDDGVTLRFQNIWDEIEFDIKKNGGVL